MKKPVVLVAASLAFILPSSGFGAADDASACGQYHGLFGAPPGGGQQTASRASSGEFKSGFVVEANRNPACHSG